MVFKRRERPSVWHQVRQSVYPRTGWRRAIEYVGHRLKRLPDTPHRIALGFACGVFVSFTPIFGFHFVLAALFAWITRGNILAALMGTFVGNPLTFPLIATVSLETGRFILGEGPRVHNFGWLQDAFFDAVAGLWQSATALFGDGPTAWNRVSGFFRYIFMPYLVGGIGPGLVTAAAFYFSGRPVIEAYQHRRRSRLLQRARQRMKLREAVARTKSVTQSVTSSVGASLAKPKPGTAS